VYIMNENGRSTQVLFTDGTEITTSSLCLNNELAAALFARNAKIARVTVTIPASLCRD